MYPMTIEVSNPDHVHTFALADGGQAFVLYDHDAESPREWEFNVSRMVTTSRDYLQPDGKHADTDLLEVARVARLNGMDALGIKRLLEADPSKYELMFERDFLDEMYLEYGANRAVVAVKEFDHGQHGEANGVAVIFAEDWEPYASSGGADWTPPSPEEVLDMEIKSYISWANGECYGVIIHDAEGNETESCWGFQGYDYDDPKIVTDHFGEVVES